MGSLKISQEVHDKITTYTKSLMGISWGFFGDSGGVGTSYFNRPCYGTLTGTFLQSKSPWLGVQYGITFEGSMVAFFAKDAIFADLIQEIYEQQYAHFLSFDQYKQSVLTDGFVIHREILNTWCKGTIMAFLMAYRDSDAIQEADTYLKWYKKTNNSQLKCINRKILKLVDEIPKVKKVYTPEEVRDFLLVPAGNSIEYDFLTKTLPKSGYGWTSGTSTVWTLMSGIYGQNITTPYEYTKDIATEIYKIDIEIGKLYTASNWKITPDIEALQKQLNPLYKKRQEMEDQYIVDRVKKRFEKAA